MPERFCIATAPLLALVLLQSVLKWLHHPPVKYVMLLHAASFWHDCLHRSRLGCCPDDCPRYSSPSFELHTTFDPADFHVRFAPAECTVCACVCTYGVKHGLAYAAACKLKKYIQLAAVTYHCLR